MRLAREEKKGRFIAMITIFVCLTAVFIFTLAKSQIIDGKKTRHRTPLRLNQQRSKQQEVRSLTATVRLSSATVRVMTLFSTLRIFPNIPSRRSVTSLLNPSLIFLKRTKLNGTMICLSSSIQTEIISLPMTGKRYRNHEIP